MFSQQLKQSVHYVLNVHISLIRGITMTTTITTADARKNLADIVNKVAYGQDPIILTRRGEEIAALVSIQELKLLQQIEDVIDIEDAKRILSEAGKNIPADEAWKQLGL